MSAGTTNPDLELFYRQFRATQLDASPTSRRDNWPAYRSQQSPALAHGYGNTGHAPTSSTAARSADFCKDCNRSFASPGALQMHVASSKFHRNPRQRQSEVVQEVMGSAPNTSLAISRPAATANAASSNALYTGTLLMLAPEGPSVSHDCDVCEREFKNPAALQAHINHSKFHEKLVRQQRPSQPAVASVSQPVPIVDEFASVSVVRGIDSLKHGNNNWTVVPDSQQAEALQALKNHCHSTIDLLKHNYVLKPVTAEDIDDLRKCKNCGDRKKKASYPCIFHPPQRKPAPKRNGNNGLPPSCCGQRGRGCKQLPVHDFGPADRRSLKKFRTYARTPAASYPQTSKRRAVTLDCEMAGVARGQAEVILLCAADYMTGETLVNSLVRPTSRVVDWRSRFSGVTAEAMATATEQGDTLDGWRGARAELWKHVDADTILVGHSLQHDLDVLRMIHTRVVDSAILARNAVGSARQWGLKALCGEFLGIDIQNGGLRGHDCMEDALAAREVVLWCLQNPSLLAGWGEMVNEQEERKRQEEADKREKMKIKTERTLPKAGEEGQGDGMRGGSSSAVGGQR